MSVSNLRVPISTAIILCVAFSFLSKEVRAQAPALDDETQDVSVSFPNTPLALILNEYEKWSGQRIIRDNAILGATVSIETIHKLTRQEAAVFVEKSLLLNGYALVPSGPDTLKIIAFTGANKPSSEGVPMFTRVEDLPDDDEVVTFILPLSHLDPEEAAKTVTQVFPPHAFGVVAPLSHAQALVITESAYVIRRIVEFRDEIDVPPSETEHKAIELQRADATEVAEALVTLLELDASNTSSGSGGATRTVPAVQSQGNQRANAQASGGPGAAAGGGAGLPGGGLGFQPVQPKVWAIQRSNRILVVGRPVDVAYIESLVAYFDAPPEEAQMLRRKLNYMQVSAFLPIASDTLLRGLVGGQTEGSQGISGGESMEQGGTASRSGSSSAGFGGGGSSGSSGLSSSGFSAGSLSLNEDDIGPQSVVIDKTLLVADNVHNTLIASGPPEHLKIIEDLLETMDQRPRQIRISAVIAQLTLGDGLEYGVDVLRTLETVGPDGRRYNGAGVLKSRTGESQSILDIDALDVVGNFLPAAQGLTLYGQINPYLNGYLSALESTNRFKVLSRPTIYTLNNRQALIFTGQKIAVPRSTSTVLDPDQNVTNQVVTSAIDFEEVLLEIAVKPLINAEDEIMLRIHQINDDIVGSQIIGGDEIPTIGTQALETTVIVPNGSTVLLGGLISEEDSKSESGLPLFVNLPLVGKVFGSTGKTSNRQELLVFIQPEIIDTNRDMVRADRENDSRYDLSDEALEFALPPDVQPVARPAKKQRNWFQKLLSGGKN